APPPRRVVEQPRRPQKPTPLLREDFKSVTGIPDRWSVGVLATPPETFDPNIAVESKGGVLTIAPLPHETGIRFSGYVSQATFNLRTSIITVELRHPAAGATTIVAAAIDAANWVGFRIENGQLSMESHAAGRIALRKAASATRFLRLRMSNVAPVVVWETSTDGTSWTPGYVETASINITALKIALSAGTTTSVRTAGAATFARVSVERKP
ncbi:MAG TPA: hypothetical protein VN181_06470, partial [Thermoanaerobaculia bacterium]|nr:hypothetical protein [Thermoanaerobaculia bacterium]